MLSTYFLSLVMLLPYGFTATAQQPRVDKTAAEILGNPAYTAISYGGFRQLSRTEVPTVAEIKEDMKLLAALDIKVLRTYNTQQFEHAARVLEAIRELKKEDPSFEMYVMLGAWIDCENAWTATPNHSAENIAGNTAEINAAVRMANAYPDIVKIIAVGNEAMVHWAASYYVVPGVILQWVNYLQDLKQRGALPADLWITSSDNFASWGGGDGSYHLPDLNALLQAVDYVSMHTYPFHDSHYNPAYWLGAPEETALSAKERAENAMQRAALYAQSQYRQVAAYMQSQGISKPIHIGETGWATVCGSLYGPNGSQAADEYKQKLYYDLMRDWTSSAGMSCFYFEAFDEQWKDAHDPNGSENHFGLFIIDGKAKYVLWDKVDEEKFKGLSRGGNPITKTYDGNMERLLQDLLTPPVTGSNTAE
ncbi:MAG TPA: glycosyl hydrolase family 17 [Bacteroidetes bacterium]|jgi:exo-beta-1,3-glucanase (GH17 family)|nr:glycosyl hydrolase family 17 [Bacteroidota bacterium]